MFVERSGKYPPANAGDGRACAVAGVTACQCVACGAFALLIVSLYLLKQKQKQKHLEQQPLQYFGQRFLWRSSALAIVASKVVALEMGDRKFEPEYNRGGFQSVLFRRDDATRL